MTKSKPKPVTSLVAHPTGGLVFIVVGGWRHRS
jgi:hypothetical protein